MIGARGRSDLLSFHQEVDGNRCAALSDQVGVSEGKSACSNHTVGGVDHEKIRKAVPERAGAAAPSYALQFQLSWSKLPDRLNRLDTERGGHREAVASVQLNQR
jgi:hypothetical protein